MAKFNSASWLALFIISLSAAASCCADDDGWASKTRIAEWDRVGAIQRYPLFDAEPAFDWESACQDDSVFVRAAAALAIGRSQDARRVALVVPQLRDSTPLVQNSALWALLQIDSPSVKEPLLDVLGSWKDEDLRRFFSAAGGFVPQTIGRTGLPYWVTTLPLAERRAWLPKFDARAWKPSHDDSQDALSYGDGQTRVQLCVERSQWDSDEPIAMRVQVGRVGGTKPMRLRIAEYPGNWFAVGRRGEASDRDEYEDRIFFPDALEFTTIDPGKSVTVDRMVSGKRPLPPGIYLFHGFHAPHAVLVRIRRSAEFERQIPALLRKIDDPKTVAVLAQQRVLEAAPALIEKFRRATRSKQGASFALAGALARIGDAAAVPVLLDFPDVGESDVVGDTSRELAAFGELAYPCYEERILAWKRLLQNGKVHTLEMCLRLLGADGSDEIDRTRLALVEEILNRRTDYSHGKHSDELAVLQAGVVAVSRRHPDKAIEFIWATRDRPNTCVALIDRLHGSHEQTLEAAPIFAALWRQFQEQAEPETRIRWDLMRVLQWTVPDVVLDDKFPLGSRDEAMIAISCARSVKIPTARARSVERVTTFLDGSPDPEVQLYLAGLLFTLENLEQCEAQIDMILLKLDEPVQKSEAHYYRGEAKIRRGAVAEGELDLQTALELLPPAHGYDGVSKETIQARLREVALIPRAAGLLIREHVMSWRVRTNSYTELIDGRSFFLDDLRNLVAWDPVRREGAVLAVIPQEVRDFMPLDQRRVFVATTDGTAALVQEGAEAPIWKRPLSLGFNSYLSASPTLITAADESGTLHALDARTGETRWSRAVQGSLWPKLWWQSHRSLIQQRGDLVLIPDRLASPITLTAVRATDGKEVWTHQSSFPFESMSIGDGLVFLAGRAGDLSAIALDDGATKWQKHLDAKAEYSRNELSIAQSLDCKQLYLAVKDQLWSLSASSGELLWDRKWIPREAAGKPGQRGIVWPKLCPTSDSLFCVVNWEAEGEYADRADVILLTQQGELLLHETSSFPQYKTHWAQDPIAQGKTLAFRKDSMWEVWEYRTPKR